MTNLKKNINAQELKTFKNDMSKLFKKIEDNKLMKINIKYLNTDYKEREILNDLLSLKNLNNKIEYLDNFSKKIKITPLNKRDYKNISYDVNLLKSENNKIELNSDLNAISIEMTKNDKKVILNLYIDNNNNIFSVLTINNKKIILDKKEFIEIVKSFDINLKKLKLNNEENLENKNKLNYNTDSEINYHTLS